MRIGLDLGGTKLEGIALDDDGTPLARRRVATPRHDYAATLEAMAGLVRDLETETGRRGTVGVGMPGALSPATGLVKNANSTWLIGQPLDHDLSALLERPVRFANDANCFALSEAVDGAAAGARVVFGVIVGTGTGGGIVVDRKVLTGPNAIAGEWGHNPLPWPRDGEWPGPTCYCGKTGCVETFLSGPGLSRDFRQAGGEEVAAPEVVSRASRGDGAAVAALERYEERMARALAAVLNVLDPDVVVLGGGMSQVGRLYESVPRLWQAWAFSDRVDTVLRPPVHGDSSGVRGAAWLWGPGKPSVPHRSLDPVALARTIELLCERVEVRFPGSGLSRICRELLGIAERTAETTAGIARPILALRAAVGLTVALLLVGLGISVTGLRLRLTPESLTELVQGLESGINDLILVGAFLFFLVTLERRVKRGRALRAIHELRSIAHVIDMHQLTKDPEWVLDRGRETGILPPRSMSRFELSRYLDYCSEALSLTGKVAALYVRDFDDPVALQAVNEVEDLTTGLSRKIWQKLSILYAMGPGSAAPSPPAGGA